MFRTFAILGSVFALSLVGAAEGFGAPPEPPTVDANVVNTEENPVPVSIVPPSGTTVLCTLSAGTASGNFPFIGSGGSGPQTLVVCPDGVDAIDVQRIGYSPDVGPNSSFSVATFRAVVGFKDPSDPVFFPASGILAVLTDGAPEAVVAQDFRLDTTDPSVHIYHFESVSSGIETIFPEKGGALYFSGTPVQ